MYSIFFNSLTLKITVNIDKNNTNYLSINNCIIERETKTLIRGCKNSIIPNNSGVNIIGDYAFSFCSGLTNIIIPNTITKIGDSSFRDTGLTNITIPEGVQYVGDSAFFRCSQLMNVVIANSVTSNLFGTFMYCKSLKSIIVNEGPNQKYKSINNCLIDTTSKMLLVGCQESVIPNDGSVTSIFIAAFNYGSIKNLIIPKDIKYIYEDAFMLFSAETITVEEGNEYYYSINNCLIEKSSKRVILGCNNSIIPSDTSVDTIGRYAFAGCNLETITIPKNIETIEYAAFSECENLTHIELPSDILRIEAYAFWKCINLKSISIPNSVEYIGSYTFSYCDKLEKILFHGTEEEWSIINKTNFDIPKDIQIIFVL